MLSNSYSAEYGGLAGVIVSTKRGANRFTASSFYDFNSNELNALTYAQTLNGVSRDDPERRHARLSLTASASAGRSITNRTFFFGNYEGSRLKAARRRRAGASCRPRRCAAAISPATSFVVRDPQTGAAVPRQPHPGRAASTRRRGSIIDCFYPLPNQPTLGERRTARFARSCRSTRNRDRADVRVDHELSSARLAVRALQLAEARPRRVHVREHRRQRRRRPDQSRPARSRSRRPSTLRLRLDAHLVEHARQRVPRRLQRRHAQPTQPVRRRATSARRSGIEVPPLAAAAPGFPSFLFSGANRPSDIRDQRPEHLPRSRPVVVLAEQQPRPG